ncbi:MAG: DUF4845 domain-containing protein [Nitrosomonas sp.]|jgi:hypothetical protein|nr:DUF4845 domain-containing protein [Nitrosomonas sp.]
MHQGMLQKQKGFTLSGLLMWSVILIMIALLGMKLAPAYIEYAAIQKTFAAITNDSTLKNATPTEIRLSFDKRASIDNIDVIRGRDIKISKDNGRTILKTDYSVIIPLFANISMLIDFKVASD